MADVGTGTAISFGTSGFSAEILSINGADISREVVDTTCLATLTYRRSMPGDLINAGTLDIEFAFAPDDTIATTSQPPITGAVELITITFPIYPGLTIAATFTAYGYVSTWSWGIPLEDRMTGSMTVQLTDDDSGSPTFTNGS